MTTGTTEGDEARMTLRLDPGVWQRVRVLAARKGTNGAALIRDWVEKRLVLEEELERRS
jgi:predicted DNA-binding protein